jgi:peptidyl-prolyl cis-trans isomerase SurA
MKQVLISILVGLLVIPSFAQTNKDSDILLEVGSEKVTVDEFMYIYNKNNRNQEVSYSIDSLKSYMDLFVNFKLKVVEAKSMGLDTLKTFKNELSGYRGQLAQPYLTDKSVENELVKEAYDRMKYDVNASHILIKLDPEVNDDDTLKAYEKAEMIRQKCLDGEDFEKLAVKYSDDKSVKSNKGKLGWFTTFGMVYPFESAVYNTEVGGFSNVIRTRFGYHVIKVNDKRPAKGRIHVAHIMVLTPNDATEDQLKQAKAKIDLINGKIKAGGNFEELAKEFSEDRRSGRDGGLLPWFGVGGKMISVFENAAYTLNNVGEISDVLRTSYGYHIIKMVEMEGIGEFDDVESNIKSRISNSARASRSKDVLLKKLKKEYNAHVYTENVDAVSELLTDSIYYGTWDATEALKLNAPIFSFADTTFTQGQFVEYLKKFNRKTEAKPIKYFASQKIESFSDKMILLYEEQNLESKYPKFRFLLKEYHDGILLFDVTDRMVWSKAVKDSVGLENFYSENKDNYKWDNRYVTRVMNIGDKKVSKSVAKYLKKNQDVEWTAIDTIFNANDSLAVQKEHWDTYEAGDNSFADSLAEKYASKLTKKSRVIIPIDGNQLLDIRLIPSATKELKEARGIITADYQNKLEKEWIKALHEKTSVNIHENVLNKLAKK